MNARGDHKSIYLNSDIDGVMMDQRDGLVKLQVGLDDLGWKKNLMHALIKFNMKGRFNCFQTWACKDGSKMVVRKLEMT
jgi:hypothetical protein